MKNASSLKTKPETPKTPGGISKSLLTPCRRVGLSKNWRKSIASPFNSPLASTEAKQDVVETRKRKESLEDTPQISDNGCENENVGTPTRKVELPRRKKSKMLLNSIVKPPEDDNLQSEPTTLKDTKDNEIATNKEKVASSPVRPNPNSKESFKEVREDNDSTGVVVTPVRLKSKSKSKRTSPNATTKVKDSDKTTNSTKTDNDINFEKENVESSNKIEESETKEVKTDTKKEKAKVIECKNKSPNNLTKECVVLIQKKIFKSQLKETKTVEVTNNESKHTSQALFNDSDSDDVPLKCLNKTEQIETITIDDDDFVTSKPKKSNSKPIKEKPSTKFPKESSKTVVKVNNPSQSSLDDDDDENFFEKKKTILIRKSYDKVIKPSKAKSTGSITQKDIEDLKARIETKKKMLLAQSMTDTKELRELIKKWQKGCQDALMELMDLMKNKCPEQNMHYSQILQTLKIPANLVGYDSDNDCFVTPEDKNIIVSHIKE